MKSMVFSSGGVPSRAVFRLWRRSASGGVAAVQFADQAVFPAPDRAQRQAQLPRPAVIEMAVEFPGEAHAAMDLDVFLGGEMKGLAARYPRRRRRHAQFRRIGVERPGAVIGVRAGQFDGDIHVRQAVLDRLIAGDRTAEGITLQGVFLSQVERRLGRDDLPALQDHRGTGGRTLGNGAVEVDAYRESVDGAAFATLPVTFCAFANKLE